MRIYVKDGKYFHKIILKEDATPDEVVLQILAEHIYVNEFEFKLFYDSYFDIHNGPKDGYHDGITIYSCPTCVDMYNLTVYLETGERVEFEARNEGNLSQIFSQLKEKFGVDFSASYLVMNNAIVEENDDFFNKIRNSNPVAFVIPMSTSSTAFNVFVEFGCLMMNIEVPTNADIKYLSEEIYHYFEIPAENISFYQNNKLLFNVDTIESLQHTLATVIIQCRLRGELNISVTYKGETKDMTVDAENTIFEVRGKICQVFAAPPTLPIYYHGDELNDSVVLWSLNDMNIRLFIEDPVDPEYANEVAAYYEPRIKDDPAAMYSYGCLLVLGKVVPKDVEKGKQLLLSAKERGHIGAIFALADLLEAGLIPEAENFNSLIFIRALASIDCCNGWYRYGKILLKKKDYNQGTNLLNKAVIVGNVLAMTCLGKNIFDQADGEELLKQASYKGHASAMKEIGKREKHENPEEARVYIDAAAKLGSGGASYLYAKEMFKQKMTQDAIKTLRIAACSGNAKAMRDLAILLKRGKGVMKDVNAAALYLQRAAAAGDLKAKYHLAKMYLSGEGVPKDENKAFELFSEASNAVIDSAIAVINLKLRGIGCEKDPSVAFSMAEATAMKGSAKAKRLMATMCETGIGTEKDKARAEQLYKEASEDDMYALYKYALIVKEISGSEESRKNAIEMLTKASDGGIVEASEELGTIYAEKEPRTALEYFRKASSKGSKLSTYWVAHILLSLDQDIQTALIYMKDAADNNIQPAIYEYYLILKEGKYCMKDQLTARQYLINGVNMGIPDAQMDLGIYYFDEKNYDEAFRLMNSAFENGITRDLSYLSRTMEILKKSPIDMHRIDIVGFQHGDIDCTVRCGDYDLEKRLFKQAADYYLQAYKKGNLTAAYKYGILLENGDGVEKNLGDALETFKFAIQSGNSDVYVHIGRILSNPEYSEFNLQSALQYYKQAADLGNAEGMFEIGSLMLENDPTTAFTYFQASYSHGLPKAAFKLGMMCQDGLGCQKNVKMAREYFKLAIDNNVGDACAPYAKILFFGIDTEKDVAEARRILEIGIGLKDPESAFIYAELLAAEGSIQKATEYYIQASDLGHTEAMNAAAVILSQSEDTVSKAAELFQKAADNGDPVAACNFAIMLANGNGVVRDYGKAMEYFKIAVNGGSVEALYNAAVLMIKINKNGQYDNQIRAYFKAAADNGNTQAMFNIGILLIEKEPKDYNTGIKYLKKACDAKVKAAFFKYAFYVLSNSNSPEDDEEAANYVLKGVECGDLDCLCLYGVMLLNGRGVPESKEDAISCFTHGASKNHLNSMYNLAMLKQKDPKTIDESLDLLKRASAAGYAYADPQLERYK